MAFNLSTFADSAGPTANDSTRSAAWNGLDLQVLCFLYLGSTLKYLMICPQPMRCVNPETHWISIFVSQNKSEHTFATTYSSYVRKRLRHPHGEGGIGDLEGDNAPINSGSSVGISITISFVLGPVYVLVKQCQLFLLSKGIGVTYFLADKNHQLRLISAINPATAIA